ncbi:metal-dependent hydrolase [Halorientalis sp.]|uniref:metal-dependent hydrolase n=1 Tax=Halorientalis sp. TaxID=1931229 RepID=UPI00262543EE|nr:metal-dependent hydrolase [Halorientalis sp.]
MMATTHAFVGAALASATLFFAPSVAPTAVAAGFVGGLLPDLDLVFEHRRTFHFPVLAPVGTLAVVAVGVTAPSATTITLAAFAVGAGVHATTDAAGGSTEPRPWLRTSDRAVYDHVRGRWLRARRWIRYDGAPEDFAVATLASLPMLVLGPGPNRVLAVAALVVSAGYVLVRKRLWDITAVVRRTAPELVASRLPVREWPEDS